MQQNTITAISRMSFSTVIVGLSTICEQPHFIYKRIFNHGQYRTRRVPGDCNCHHIKTRTRCCGLELAA